MITNSSTFCPAPWTGLNIDQTGRVSPCMHAVDSIGNIKQNSLQEIMSGHKLKSIQSAMSQGQWHDTCRLCRIMENTTGASPRTVRVCSEQTKSHIDNNIDWFEPQHLVVNWSNLCNLTCVYCNAETSTAWQAIKGIPIQFVRNQHQDLIDLVKQHGKVVQGLTLGGGEPLLQKGLVEFLQCLDSQQVRVLVTTNLSVDLATNPVYQELKKWKTVEWQISFDNVNPDQFEYVRKGASWQQFENNIELMRTDGQWIKAHPAYSIYCAFDLVSFYRYCVDKQLDIFWCDLSHPWDLDTKRLSKFLRQLASDQIDLIVKEFGSRPNLAIGTLQRYQKQLQDNSYLVNIDSYWADPLRYCAQIEKELSCVHTFAELWPELHKLLQEHHYTNKA